MAAPTEIIATARLILRRPLPADLPMLHEHVFFDPAVMRHAFASRPLSLPEAARFFGEKFDHQATGRKIGVLTLRATAEVIGFAGLLPCDALGEADYEFGFVLRRTAWGKGYASEIGRGQLDYGFGVLGLKRLLALASPDNAASIAVLEKLGMKLHGRVHDAERGARLVYVADRC